MPDSLPAFVLNIIHSSSTPSWLVLDFFVINNVSLFNSSTSYSGAGFPGRRLVATLRHALTGSGLLPLRHGDRNSMRWSIESRVPFLTIDIAEFILQLPESYLLGSDGETSTFFALQCEYCLDSVLDRRDKIGLERL